jgi:hypothetical protein
MISPKYYICYVINLSKSLIKTLFGLTFLENTVIKLQDGDSSIIYFVGPWIGVVSSIVLKQTLQTLATFLLENLFYYTKLVSLI